MSNDEVRDVTELKVLAALAHPLRRRLMDVLKVDGPSTPSMLAERTGQAVANVSHHMKVLAGCDLVAEAPELARDRRERWWRLVSPALRWSTGDFDDDPAAQAVAGAAEALNLDRQMGLVKAWYAVRESEKEQWSEGPFATDSWLRLTPQELSEFEAQLLALVDSWKHRETSDEPREPVFFFAHAVPAKP